MKYYIPSTSWIPDYSFTLYVSFPAFYSTPSNVGLFQNINNTNITNTNNKRDRSRLGGDVLAGMTVACMLIPQSVSYASSLAKLSPVSGLVRPFFLPLLGSNPHHSAKKKKKKQISASLPGIIYAFLGSSRQLNVAPEASLSLLVGQAVSDILVHDGYRPGSDAGNRIGDGSKDGNDVEAIKLAVATVITFQVCPLDWVFFLCFLFPT